MTSYYIGVDVGTNSVRAALINNKGKVISIETHSIHIFEPDVGRYEQSAENIWEACCKCVKNVTECIDKQLVRGIGFDATCSLVVMDTDGRPLLVSPSGNSSWNIIMWMDHRAEEEARLINSTKHEVLHYVGGSVSLEMQTPKLLWLKKNVPSTWEKAAHFFDLPDYLTWRATGALSRSLCSVVCKWTYLVDQAGKKGWQDDFFSQIGLQDLVQEGYFKIGNEVNAPGDPSGEGLSQQAASDLDLPRGVAVGSSIIDAHSGGLGCLGCQVSEPELCDISLSGRLALICGTSTCHMTVSEQPVFVPGVWGPYFSAMVPGMWTNEGGQSAAGKLIDHVVETHPAYSWIQAEAIEKKKHAHDVLNEVLESLARKEEMEDPAFLTRDLHVWPDYHGNRSPVANASLKGMVCGLTLTHGVEDLARQYLATVQALALSTKHIIDCMEQQSHVIRMMIVCGGLSNNPLYVQAHADVTGLPIVKPHTGESVLLGAAMLGACASKDFKSIQDAMKEMGGSGDVIWPKSQTSLTLKMFYSKKYEVFLKMLDNQKEYQAIMLS